MYNDSRETAGRTQTPYRVEAGRPQGQGNAPRSGVDAAAREQCGVVLDGAGGQGRAQGCQGGQLPALGQEDQHGDVGGTVSHGLPRTLGVAFVSHPNMADARWVKRSLTQKQGPVVPGEPGARGGEECQWPTGQDRRRGRLRGRGVGVAGTGPNMTLLPGDC